MTANILGHNYQESKLLIWSQNERNYEQVKQLKKPPKLKVFFFNLFEREYAHVHMHTWKRWGWVTDNLSQIKNWKLNQLHHPGIPPTDF